MIVRRSEEKKIRELFFWVLFGHFWERHSCLWSSWYILHLLFLFMFDAFHKILKNKYKNVILSCHSLDGPIGRNTHFKLYYEGVFSYSFLIKHFGSVPLGIHTIFFFFQDHLRRDFIIDLMIRLIVKTFHE